MFIRSNIKDKSAKSNMFLTITFIHLYIKRQQEKTRDREREGGSEGGREGERERARY